MSNADSFIVLTPLGIKGIKVEPREGNWPLCLAHHFASKDFSLKFRHLLIVDVAFYGFDDYQQHFFCQASFPFFSALSCAASSISDADLDLIF